MCSHLNIIKLVKYRSLYPLVLITCSAQDIKMSFLSLVLLSQFWDSLSVSIELPFENVRAALFRGYRQKMPPQRRHAHWCRNRCHGYILCRQYSARWPRQYLCFRVIEFALAQRRVSGSEGIDLMHNVEVCEWIVCYPHVLKLFH